MKKSELQEHSEEYHRRMQIASTAEANGYYREAIDWAISAWPFIDGMMQFERRYNEKDFYGIDAIDLVLRYAPLILSLEKLDRLDELLRERKRIEKHTEEDVTAKVVAARQQVSQNHRLWCYLEANPGTRQNDLVERLGGRKRDWDQVIQGWLKMSLVTADCNDGFTKLSLRTRMGQVVKARCPCCGCISEGPKGIFLDSTRCLECHQDVLFVIKPDLQPVLME